LAYQAMPRNINWWSLTVFDPRCRRIHQGATRVAQRPVAIANTRSLTGFFDNTWSPLALASCKPSLAP